MLGLMLGYMLGLMLGYVLGYVLGYMLGLRAGTARMHARNYSWLESRQRRAHRRPAPLVSAVSTPVGAASMGPGMNS